MVDRKHNRINGIENDDEQTEFESEAEGLGSRVWFKYRSTGPNSLWRFAFAMVAVTAMTATVFYLIYRVLELKR